MPTIVGFDLTPPDFVVSRWFLFEPPPHILWFPVGVPFKPPNTRIKTRPL